MPTQNKLLPTGKGVNRETLATQTEELLRLDIILGLLKPGERLITQELERRYRVSATPLREALRRLTAVGLVNHEPNYGATVAPTSVADLRDIYNVRIDLEAKAVSQSIQEGNADWARNVEKGMSWLRRISLRLREDARRKNVLEWSEAHREFHFALMASCQSPWLMRFVSILYEHSERYRMLTAWGKQVKRDSLSEHEQICQLALARDVEGTVMALRRHLNLTVELLDPDLIKQSQHSSAPVLSSVT